MLPSLASIPTFAEKRTEDPSPGRVEQLETASDWSRAAKVGVAAVFLAGANVAMFDAFSKAAGKSGTAVLRWADRFGVEQGLTTKVRRGASGGTGRSFSNAAPLSSRRCGRCGRS